MPSPPRRRFRRPWKVEERKESFIVRTADGYPICYLYHEEEPTRRDATKRLSWDEARRIANRIAKLPELIEIEKQFRSQP